MKKAIIICILSLSVCLSHAAPSTDEHTESTTNTTKGKNETVMNPVTADKTITTVIPSSNIPTTVSTTKAIVDTNATTATTEKTNDNNSKQTLPTTAKTNDTAESTTKATATVQTTSTKIVTTTHAITEKPTEASKTEKPTLAARGFDSPSFFGGIVLTLGLLAIGFMGFKYYKNQTERNYHTL